MAGHREAPAAAWAGRVGRGARLRAQQVTDGVRCARAWESGCPLERHGSVLEWRKIQEETTPLTSMRS